MKELSFLDGKFRLGYNTTCRLGTKHFLELSVGDVISLGGKLRAQVVSLDNKPFYKLSNAEVSSNHVARTKQELTRAMTEYYREKFDPMSSNVTIIGFDLL